ncbi:unnamed protein product, partial [Discosporangium mesarthrocarpum]
MEKAGSRVVATVEGEPGRGFGTGRGSAEDRALGAREDRIQVDCTSNDGDPDRMAMLIGVKEIVCTELPKMPREHIVRIILDRRHKNLVISRDGDPIAAATFRPFYGQCLAELTFCVVTGTEKGKGFGSRLMNELKEYIKLEGLTHLHTYADNFAVKYFEKHGFTRHIDLACDRWVGYIKTYHGSTHLECYVHPTVPYMHQKKMLKMQLQLVLERILEKIREGSCSHLHLLAQQRSVGSGEEALDRTEEMWQGTGAGSSGEGSGGQLCQRLLGIWKEVEENKNAWPFRAPVNAEDYLKLVSTPIDLETIKKRIEDTSATPPHYTSVDGLHKDMKLMVHNCQKYNPRSSAPYKASMALMSFMKHLFSSESEKERCNRAPGCG